MSFRNDDTEYKEPEEPPREEKMSPKDIKQYSKWIEIMSSDLYLLEDDMSRLKGNWRWVRDALLYFDNKNIKCLDLLSANASRDYQMLFVRTLNNLIEMRKWSQKRNMEYAYNELASEVLLILGKLRNYVDTKVNIYN